MREFYGRYTRYVGEPVRVEDERVEGLVAARRSKSACTHARSTSSLTVAPAVLSRASADAPWRFLMAVRTEVNAQEAADRLALRELFDAYAHCADRRDAEGQKALFTDDTVFAVYMNGDGSEPTYVLNGRESLTPVFDDLNRYEVTTHFNGQSTVALDGDHATGESYTIAHHLYTEDGTRKIMVASLRYLDTFAKIDGAWYFAERKLILDWSETRTITAPTT